MNEERLEQIVDQLNRLSAETEHHRNAISRIAAERRELVDELSALVGPTRAAKALNISRQVLWQILNPQRSREIKRKSSARRTGNAVSAQNQE